MIFLQYLFACVCKWRGQFPNGCRCVSNVNTHTNTQILTPVTRSIYRMLYEIKLWKLQTWRCMQQSIKISIERGRPCAPTFALSLTLSLSRSLCRSSLAPVCLITLSSPLNCDALRSALLSATRRDFIFTLASGGETRYMHRERECGERRMATADCEIFEMIWKRFLWNERASWHHDSGKFKTFGEYFGQESFSIWV